MLLARQWFSELGLIPVGNEDPVQKELWEKPGDAGSISERGRSAAAASKAKVNLQIMADRGLKEEVTNPLTINLYSPSRLWILLFS